MALNLPNLGNIPNDGTGDDLYTAFTKVNAALSDLDTRSEATTASNTEDGFPVFREQVGNELQFNTLQVDPLLPDSMTIRIVNGQVMLASKQANFRYALDKPGDPEDGVILVSNPSKVVYFKPTQGADIQLNRKNEVDGLYNIEVAIDSQLFRETNPRVSTDLSLEGNNLVNVGGIDGLPLDSINELFSWDFGDLNPNPTSIIDFIVNAIDVDFGTMNDPNPQFVDFGVL
jgi:hypothetical protein